MKAERVGEGVECNEFSQPLLLTGGDRKGLDGRRNLGPVLIPGQGQDLMATGDSGVRKGEEGGFPVRWKRL